MSKTIKIISPVDGRLVAERQPADDKDIRTTTGKSLRAQTEWQHVELADKAEICHKAVDLFLNKKEEIAEEITLQMGRPLSSSPGELSGVEERARFMIDIGQQSIQPLNIENDNRHRRIIKRVPRGTVVCIAPWNYPYLTAINTVIPAIMAGNSLILKHAAQTLLCAERLYDAFSAAGLPDGVFQYLHLDHQQTCQLLQHPDTAFIAFTGSVRGGAEIENCLAGTFKGLALELGGKDPAYVRADANLEYSVAQLVDGAFFNSGQSCCAVERIYVHEKIHDEFISQFIAQVEKYQPGNPLDPNTTLGPVVNSQAAARVQEHIQEAVAKGAKLCVDEKKFSQFKPHDNYLLPQVLTRVDHNMRIMTEETFGPVVGIMKVANDQEALALMNDSRYGLTASIWTEDLTEAEVLGDKINTGTVFMNRCDYLDPALAWTGIKQSGRGCSLSTLGYEQLTRPKSYHLRTGGN